MTAYRYQPERIPARGAIPAAVAFVTALKTAPHQMNGRAQSHKHKPSAERESRKPHKGTKVAHSNSMTETAYAFPKEEKEPINDASHVRNAIARFNQVKDVTDSERDAAWKRIKTAAKKFGVEVNEEDWRELSHHGGKR